MCYCQIGYSRVHRSDLHQFVNALMVTPSKVLEGNTQAVTTLPDVVKNLKNRFGLTRCHLVDNHLNFLEQQELTYLSAMDKDERVCHS